MKKKTRFYPTFGYSSILFIFILLCMVTFSILSVVTAQSDYHLTEKNAQRTLEYYDACNEAQLWLSDVDSTLSYLCHSVSDEPGYYAKCTTTFQDEETFTKTGSGYTLTKVFPLTGKQSLTVTLAILYPAKESDTFYQIMDQELVNTESTEDYTETYNLLGTDH